MSVDRATGIAARGSGHLPGGHSSRFEGVPILGRLARAAVSLDDLVADIATGTPGFQDCA